MYLRMPVFRAIGLPFVGLAPPNNAELVSFDSPQNSIYWNYEVQAWLARYIGGTPMAAPVFEEVPSQK